MKTRRSQLGLSILAGGLSFVGSANAVDLISNGSFESGSTGWLYFRTYNYSAAYFTGPAIPASEGAGSVYSWRHGNAVNAWTSFVTPTNETDHLQYNLRFADAQTVNLTNALTGAAIDSGLGQYTFSAWLASYGQPGSNPEQPYLVLRFFDNSGTSQIGGNVIFDRTTATYWVTNADPNDATPPDAGNHMWSKYVTGGSVPAGARTATVYITRSPNSGLSGSPDTYVDLVKLNVININDTTILDAAAPGDGTSNNSPAPTILVSLKDISTQVNTNSIQLRFDGTPVTPAIQKSGANTTVQYNPPGVLAPLSTHTYRIVWSDNGSPVTTKTNQFQFTVAPYVNITTGPPLYLETFDSVAEGSLPAGWSVTNATDQDIPGPDLNNFHSDSYLDWVVISRSTLSNLFSVLPGGADYVSTVNVAPNQVVNSSVVNNLISGNFVLAASTDRFGNQVQTLFSGDYNLTGKTNVYLIFNNIYAQNQDSIGAIEYSINGGASWLPALYLLDGPDILRDSLGNIDASNTFAFDYSGNAAEAPPPPGNYGAFIGVPQSQWSTLAPYLSARVNDDLTGSKRIEVVRLAQADNQPAVRFRIAQAGNNSWYFGIDNFGLYSLTVTNTPIIVTPPANQVVAVGNSISLSASAIGIGPLTYQWHHAGTNLPGRTSAILGIPAAQLSDGGNYEIVVSNPAGSVTSSPPAVLTVLNPIASVTGQWDFNQGDLRATCGADLLYYDSFVQTNTSFGTTTSFGILDINGQPAHVMYFTPASGNAGGLGGANPSIEAWGGYKMFHGAAANGGGTNVNQYTLIFDVYYPANSDHSWRAVIQAATSVATGGDDSEYYINTFNGIGISGIYDGNITAEQWHRIALAVDMAGPGPHPVVEKFIDGVKVGEQTGGLDILDGRFSLSPSLALLFAEDNGYNNDAYVSSVQFRNARLSDAAIAALGGPSANKIPGALCVSHQGANVIVNWSGTTLQSADDINGPWTTIAGAAKPYQVPAPLGAKKFYRAQ